MSTHRCSYKDLDDTDSYLEEKNISKSKSYFIDTYNKVVFIKLTFALWSIKARQASTLVLWQIDDIMTSSFVFAGTWMTVVCI